MQEFSTVSVADMMEAREARCMMQRQLLSRYEGAALVCLTMNIAGPVKNTPAVRRAFDWGMERIAAVLAANRVLFRAQISEKTGPEAVFAVSGDAGEIKRRLCALEDGCAMGRLLDIDVIGADGEKLSRTDVGLPPRRCLLCEEAAPVCARSRRHSAKELFARANEIIGAHFEDEYAKRIAQQAQRALLYEVAIAPKPGLVDRLNAGAHADMDIFTFIDSACSLRDYFETCARTGLAYRRADATDCFDALRTPGLLAERAMYGATGGVNTHKGAVFSLGILCASLGMGYETDACGAEAALERCGEMTAERMRREMSAIEQGAEETFGAELYRKCRVGGVRGEAAQGFPHVRKAALPRLRQCLEAGLSLNDAGLCALAALMAAVEDTNAVRRGGEEGAVQLREEAAQMNNEITALLAGRCLKAQMDDIRARLAAWDAQLSAARISPGGCADLLAMTLLAHFMEA